MIWFLGVVFLYALSVAFMGGIFKSYHPEWFAPSDTDDLGGGWAAAVVWPIVVSLRAFYKRILAPLFKIAYKLGLEPEETEPDKDAMQEVEDAIKGKDDSNESPSNDRS